MSLNEVTYLLLGFGGGIFFCWLYFKYKLRNMPSVQVLLHRSGALLKETREALDGSKNREKELDRLLSNLSKSLEDPKDILH